MNWLKRIFGSKPSPTKSEPAVHHIPPPAPPKPPVLPPPPKPSPEPDEPGVLKIRRWDGKVVVRIPGDSLLGADLSNMDLTDADFCKRDLSNAILRNCVLRGAKFEDATMRNADFSGSKTEAPGSGGARFRGANLEGANFSNAELDYGNFYNANLTNTNFQGASVCTASFENAVLRDTNFSGANLEYSVIPRLKYPIRYDSSTRWPARFSPTDIEQPFQGNCPNCGERCRLERSPFSEDISIYRCSKGHFTAVQCASCEKDVMVRVEDLDCSVHAECASCRWTSTGIPKDWWHKNVRS